MVDGFAKTPRYVLKDGSCPTCPSVSQASPDAQATVIFGFSDKPEYDVFLKVSSLALTPYPLVKGFLENQVAMDIGSLKLIVLDAKCPQQLVLHAAAMQDVLASFDIDSDCVEISHELSFDETSQGYELKPYSRTTLKRYVS